MLVLVGLVSKSAGRSPRPAATSSVITAGLAHPPGDPPGQGVVSLGVHGLPLTTEAQLAFLHPVACLCPPLPGGFLPQSWGIGATLSPEPRRRCGMEGPGLGRGRPKCQPGPGRPGPGTRLPEGLSSACHTARGDASAPSPTPLWLSWSPLTPKPSMNESPSPGGSNGNPEEKLSPKATR